MDGVIEAMKAQGLVINNWVQYARARHLLRAGYRLSSSEVDDMWDELKPRRDDDGAGGGAVLGGRGAAAAAGSGGDGGGGRGGGSGGGGGRRDRPPHAARRYGH